MYTYQFNDEGKNALVIETEQNVFYPTDTSALLIDACRACITSPKKILDLGCGSGLVGIALARAGCSAGTLSASDMSADAVALAKRNATAASLEYDARCGSLFTPWADERFDVIVDDVAGIADDVARLSSWYPPGVDCNAGRDGTDWIVSVIRESKRHLQGDGMFIFPLLSLSNEEKILDALHDTYESCTMIMQKNWFLPDPIAREEKLVRSLMAEKAIRCEEKFGKFIWTTTIYKAQ